MRELALDVMFVSGAIVMCVFAAGVIAATIKSAIETFGGKHE